MDPAQGKLKYVLEKTGSQCLMGTSHLPMLRSSVQSWDVARLCLSLDICPLQSQMDRSGLKSSGVRGRSLSSGSAPEYPVQGARATTVELFRLSVQVRCRSGLNLPAHSVGGRKSCDFAEILLCFVFSFFLPAYTEVRLLTNSSSQCEGQVEMNISGQWRVLCASHWSLANANVVCRQLGCGVAISTPEGAEGNDQLWKARFHCWGDESFLWECAVTALGDPDCSHGNTASVICSGRREGRATGTQHVPGVRCPQEQRMRGNRLQRLELS